MNVIFIFGPAAAGKFTVGSLVAKELCIPLFHNHLTVDLASSLFDFGTAGFRRLRERIWMESFEQAAIANLSFVFTFQPEASVESDLIARLQACIEDNGGDVQYIELVCPDDEIYTRLNNPSRQSFGKLTDPELYKQLQASGAFEYSAMPEPILRIQSDKVAAEEAAEQIIQLVTSELDQTSLVT